MNTDYNFESIVQIKTLSPVFIDSGHKLGQFEYLYDNGKLYKLNLKNCFNFIFDKRKDAMDKLNYWAESKSSLLDTNPNRARDSYNLNIFDFIGNGQYLNDKNLEQNLKDEIRKSVNNLSDYCISAENNPQGKDISSVLKNANNEVYIPGSTIKGQIRTALMKEYLLNMPENELKSLGNELTEKLKDNRLKRDKVADFIENKLFYCGSYQNDRIVYRDEKFDIMKFIHLTDTNSLNPSESLVLLKSELYLNTKAEIQGQAPIIEAIKSNIQLSFRISVDVNYILNILNKKDKTREWINFERKFRNLFQVDLMKFQNNPKEIGKLIVKNIQESLLKFSNHTYNNDISWIETSEKKKVLKGKNHYDDFLGKLDEEGINVKLGHGTGYLNNTIFDILRDEKAINPLEILNNRNLNILKGKIDKDKIIEFPKSRTLVGSLDKKVALGWINLKFKI